MRRIVALTVTMCAFAATAVRATEPFAKVGTYAAAWLQFPRGARNIGMGATGVADVSGSATGYFNPASMAWSNATTLLGSYEDFGFAGINLSEILVASPIPFHADATMRTWRFGGSFGYAHLGMEPQIERTIFLPEGIGRTFDASDWMLSATGATSWTHGVMTLGAGGAARFLRSNLAEAHANAWVFDVGAIAAFPVKSEGGLLRPRVGYALLNLDNGVSYDDRTSDVSNEQRVGFGVDLETARVMVANRSVPVAALSVDYDAIDREASPSAPDYSMGFELTAINALHFRYGTIDDDYTTFGIGVGWDDGHTLLRGDYAHVNSGGGIAYENFIDRNTFGVLIGMRW